MAGGHTETFRTHANYLHAFGMLCHAPYQKGVTLLMPAAAKVLGNLAPVIAAAPSMSAPQKAKPDIAQARASLTNAWGTELLLALGGEVATDEELVRLVNNWAVVQAYYAGYHATQALAVARGYPRPESHPKTQAHFATAWADRPLELPPWSLAACDGGWTNPPARGIDDSLNSWSGRDPGSCWNLAAKALRTTRQEKVTETLGAERNRRRSANRKAWTAEEAERLARGKKPRVEPRFARPRLGAEDKRKLAGRVRSYTVLDYLYRLRVKTNYEDAGMFIDGPEDELASRRVHRDLVSLTGCTMLLHELHAGAIVGRSRLLGWVDDWLAKNAAGAATGLGLRRDLLDSHTP
jgi:hypothetical protein